MANAADLLVRLLVDDSDLDKVDGAGSKFEKFSNNAMKGALLAGGAAAGALTVGFIGAMDAQASQSRMAASLGLGADESQRLGSVAGALYADAYGGSLEEVQEAVATVMSSIDGMATASDESLSRATQNALNFASAFGVDVARSTQVAGQLISTGLATDADNAFDLLTGAFQRVPVAVREDLLDAADEYGPFFQQLGVDGTTAFGMLTQASEKGMYGIDKTGDALKEFTIRATDMSKATGVAYATLGLNQTDMTNQLLAGGDQAAGAFAQIVHGLQGIQDPAAQSQAALALFGTPLEDLGTSEIPNFLGLIDPMGDAFDDMSGSAAAMGDTLSGSAANGWENFQRSASQSLQDVAAAALPVVQPMIDMLGQFAPILGPLVVTVGAVAGAVVAMGAAFRAVMFIQTLVATLSLLRGATLVSTSATVAQTAAQWANNAAWLASPVTWIVLAIIAAIGLLVAAGIWLYQNWDGVVQAVGAAWTWVWDTVLSPVFGFIGAAVTWLVDEVFAPIGGFIGSVVQGIAAVFSWLYNSIILPVVTAIMVVFGIWAGIITWIWESIVLPVFGWIGEQVTVLGMVFSVLWSTYVQPAIDAIGVIIGWLWNSVISPAFAAVGAAVNAVGAAFSWLYNSVIAPVGSFISTAVYAVGAVFSVLWAAYVQPAINAVAGALNWVWGSIISPTFNAISGAVQWVGKSIRDVFGGIGDFIGSAFQAALGAVRGPVNGIIGLVNSAIRGLNTLSVTIPAWVPMVGGQTWGLSIPTIPMLATGTITDGPMLAIVGDNPGGREVIAPYDSYVRDLQGAYMAGQAAPLAVTVGVAPSPDATREEVARIVAELNRRGGGDDRPAGPVDLSDATIAALVAGLLAAIRSGAKRSSLTALGV